MGGDCAALADALVLAVGVGGAVGVQDLKKRSLVDGFDLVANLRRESHSFEDAE